MSGPANLDTKANPKKLRELSTVAHVRELSAELAKLEADFARWRSGEIDPFELSDRIHRFHDGPSRQIFTTYRDIAPVPCVARALAYRILDRAEVPSDLLAALEPFLRFYEPEEGESLEPPSPTQRT